MILVRKSKRKISSAYLPASKKKQKTKSKKQKQKKRKKKEQTLKVDFLPRNDTPLYRKMKGCLSKKSFLG